MIDPRHDRSEEFAQLLGRYERLLFSYILAVVWNRHDAEDLYQRTAMTLWEKFDEFRPGTNFPAWACSTARLLISNFQRAQRRRRVFLSPDLAAKLADKQSAVTAQDSDALAEALVDCVRQLAEADRRLIDLCYGEGQAITKIAAEAGRPAQSVYNSLVRIRHALFECIRRATSGRADP